MLENFASVVQTLNVPQRVRLGPRHRRLTNSAARTNVVLLIRRTVRLTAALLNDLFEHPVDYTLFSRHAPIGFLAERHCISTAC